MAKFPDKPTKDDSQALKSFVHLFARLYPCGECARHFQQILQKFPPQVASRSVAATWACHVHNEVNKSLNKDEFDCSKIGDFYDCGCADDEPGDSKGKGLDQDGFKQLELEKEG
jgi:FAD-linked sulfhydryl oxidase